MCLCLYVSSGSVYVSIYFVSGLKTESDNLSLLDLVSFKGCVVIQSAGWSKLMALTQEQGIAPTDVDYTDVCICVFSVCGGKRKETGGVMDNILWGFSHTDLRVNWFY